MLQESPKQRGIKKTKAGKKQTSKVPYARSKSKKFAKGEPIVNPLSYPGKFSYTY